ALRIPSCELGGKRENRPATDAMIILGKPVRGHSCGRTLVKKRTQTPSLAPEKTKPIVLSGPRQNEPISTAHYAGENEPNFHCYDIKSLVGRGLRANPTIALPPCGGGLGWGVLFAQETPEAPRKKRTQLPLSSSVLLPVILTLIPL